MAEVDTDGHVIMRWRTDNPAYQAGAKAERQRIAGELERILITHVIWPETSADAIYALWHKLRDGDAEPLPRVIGYKIGEDIYYPADVTIIRETQ